MFTTCNNLQNKKSSQYKGSYIKLEMIIMNLGFILIVMKFDIFNSISNLNEHFQPIAEIKKLHRQGIVL